VLRAVRAEMGKLKRSRVPLWTAAVVTLWPLYTILVIRLTSGSLRGVTWRDSMVLGPQTIASWWGILLGGFVAAYVFGREFSDSTMRNTLTLPIRRECFVASKLAVVLVWVFALCLLSVAAQAAYAVLLGSDGFAWEYVLGSLRDSLLVMLTIAATLPLVGWIAVVGRGYLAPMIFSGVAFVSGVLFLQAGWERWVPWAMPMALVGMGWVPGETKSSLVAASWVILGAVFLAGVAALIVQVDYADCLE
jgi:ABC-2 type transport system permease protein